MPWVYIGTSPLKCAYVWTTPVKCIYVWTTKVRPVVSSIWIVVVWGWGGWGDRGWWGGWGWGVIGCGCYILDRSKTSYAVKVGAWGIANNGAACPWCSSYFECSTAWSTFYAYWGGYGSNSWCAACCYSPAWSGGGWGTATNALYRCAWKWTTWQWNSGGVGSCRYWWWGGGWKSGGGTNSASSCAWKWGNGGLYCWFGTAEYYWWGGGWGANCNNVSAWVAGCWGGAWWACGNKWGDANWYGGWGWGWGRGCCWGAGCQGVVLIRYHTNWSDGISPNSTGGTKSTSWDYTIHKFTCTTSVQYFCPVYT